MTSSQRLQLSVMSTLLLSGHTSNIAPVERNLVDFGDEFIRFRHFKEWRNQEEIANASLQCNKSSRASARGDIPSCFEI